VIIPNTKVAISDHTRDVGSQNWMWSHNHLFHDHPNPNMPNDKLVAKPDFINTLIISLLTLGFYEELPCLETEILHHDLILFYDL
jgi:hypothetical protein